MVLEAAGDSGLLKVVAFLDCFSDWIAGDIWLQELLDSEHPVLGQYFRVPGWVVVVEIHEAVVDSTEIPLGM